MEPVMLAGIPHRVTTAARRGRDVKWAAGQQASGIHGHGGNPVDNSVGKLRVVLGRIAERVVLAYVQQIKTMKNSGLDNLFIDVPQK